MERTIKGDSFPDVSVCVFIFGSGMDNVVAPCSWAMILQQDASDNIITRRYFLTHCITQSLKTKITD
jgi:hypothetical protein